MSYRLRHARYAMPVYQRPEHAWLNKIYRVARAALWRGFAGSGPSWPPLPRPAED
jgi:hypothetical protein